MASIQYLFRTFASVKMALAVSRICLFFRSKTPFYWGYKNRMSHAVNHVVESTAGTGD